jgi:hypothetical protein
MIMFEYLFQRLPTGGLSTSSQAALLRPGLSANLSVSGMFRSGTGCRANGGAFWRAGSIRRI